MTKKRIRIAKSDLCSCKLGKKYHINPLYCLSCGLFWPQNEDQLRNIIKNRAIMLENREIAKNSRKKTPKKEENLDTF